MSPSIDQFWSLVRESRLLAEPEFLLLSQRFNDLRGAGQGNARALSTWLINERVLSDYQARVLLAGRAGPFVFGDYRIQDRVPSPLGITRFAGIHLPTNHQVLLHFHAGGPDDWRSAKRLVRQHVSLSHAHLDRCYELVKTDAHRFAASENVQGTSLRDLIAADSVSPDNAIRFVAAVGRALSQLQATGLVHSFVTPDEIVIQSGNYAKLRRFPITTIRPFDFQQDDSKGRLLQLADYLAPELRCPGQIPDARSDIYALGCTLFHALTGQPPFAGDDVDVKMNRHAAEPIPRLPDQGLSGDLNAVVSWMMAKDPAARYQHASEAAEKLEALMGHAPSPSLPQQLPTEEAFFSHQRSRKQTPPPPPGIPDPHAGPAAESNLPQAPVAPSSSDSIPLGPAGPVPATTPAVRISSASIRETVGRRRPLKSIVAAILGLCVLTTLIAVIDNQRRQRADSEPSTRPSENVPLASDTSAADGASDPDSDMAVSNSDLDVDVVDDDGATLWVSPTQGGPIDLQYAPPSAQCFVHLRPRAILNTSEGPAVVKSLGRQFTGLQQRLKRVDVSVEQVDQLLAAFVPQDIEAPRSTLVLRFNSAEKVTSIASKASNTRELDQGRRLEIEGTAVYLPAADPQVIVLGPSDDVDEVATSRGTPPLLKRQVEKLRSLTDVQRHFTVLLDPQFLAADGRSLMSGDFAALREPILEFLGDRIQAVSLSMHFEGHFFGELRLAGTLDVDPQSLAADRQQKLATMREQLNSHMGTVMIERFWQPLAVRFPAMIQVLHEQTRVGVEDGCAIVNFVLPEHAAHNLVLASVLAAEASTASVDPDVYSHAPSLEWRVILAHPLDFEIPQQSLEFTMRDLALGVNDSLPEAGLEIRIEGADLQADGITRNQQIRDVKLSNQPLDAVLTELVRRANPLPATDPTSVDQKLIWVVAPAEIAGGKRLILITTREAAAKKGYTLPQQFLEKPPGA